jgi:pimeloyl-ACP methyl ester carboxylesterase
VEAKQVVEPHRHVQPRSATLGILEGAGHYPHVDCPGELARVVTSFLAEHVHA